MTSSSRVRPDVAHVSFTGDSGDILEDIPEIGLSQRFTIIAKVIGDKVADRKDGELRRSVSYQLVSVQPGEIIFPKPEAEQLTLGDPPPLGQDGPEPAPEKPLPNGPYNPFARPDEDDAETDDVDDVDEGRGDDEDSDGEQ